MNTNDTYEDALKRANGNLAHCDDAAVMAALLQASAQLLLGAVSPKLIWQGAQAGKLTALQLSALIAHDPDKARDLMWAGP